MKNKAPEDRRILQDEAIFKAKEFARKYNVTTHVHEHQFGQFVVNANELNGLIYAGVKVLPNGKIRYFCPSFDDYVAVL